MNTPFDAIAQTGDRIVYVRPIAVADLPEEIREQIEGPEEVVYAVHDTDGQRLALVADRAMAFHLARAHDFAPVSAH
jgi:hypothetical protein